jgi:hypothetical protein
VQFAEVALEPALWVRQSVEIQLHVQSAVTLLEEIVIIHLARLRMNLIKLTLPTLKNDAQILKAKDFSKRRSVDYVEMTTK